jgi:hypothetical protein
LATSVVGTIEDKAIGEREIQAGVLKARIAGAVTDEAKIGGVR